VLPASLRVADKDSVTLRETDTEREEDADTDSDGVGDASTLPEALLERVPDKDTDRVREAVGTVTVTLQDRVGETDCDKVKDAERLKLRVVLGARLGLAVVLADVEGDALALASHWQQACRLTPQSSSATAPLTKAPGERTLRQVPAPVGCACPAAGVPHQLAFVSKKYAADRPEDHAQFAVARLADASDATPPSQYAPGEADSAPPHVRPPPATLAPVTASSTAASPQPAPRATHVACAAAQLPAVVAPK
jgi:hypothetical protein